MHFLQDTMLPKLGNLKPVTWFGIFGIAGMILSAIVMHFMEKKLKDDDKNKNGKLLLCINIFYISFMFIFAITKRFNLMLIAYLATSTFRTINEPIFSAWLNGHIDDKARSTVLSINGQINFRWTNYRNHSYKYFSEYGYSMYFVISNTGISVIYCCYDNG